MSKGGLHGEPAVPMSKGAVGRRHLTGVGLGILALVVAAFSLSCGSPREVLSMVGHEATYSPRLGNRISAIGANQTDSGMLQICMAVYDGRANRRGRHASREYSLEIWPDELLPANTPGALEELSLEGLDDVIWKRGERSCSEWNRTKKESVETGWLKIYYFSGKKFALDEAAARSGNYGPPKPPKRAVFYTVEGPVGTAQFLFFGRPTSDSSERRILFTLDGQHIRHVF